MLASDKVTFYPGRRCRGSRHAVPVIDLAPYELLSLLPSPRAEAECSDLRELAYGHILKDNERRWETFGISLAAIQQTTN